MDLALIYYQYIQTVDGKFCTNVDSIPKWRTYHTPRIKQEWVRIWCMNSQ